MSQVVVPCYFSGAGKLLMQRKKQQRQKSVVAVAKTAMGTV